MTIAVRADLKARIDGVKDDANWSAIACRAFEQELAKINSRKGADAVRDTIERLRASKQKADDESIKEGFAAGQRWAKDAAEAEELERLTDLRQSSEQDSWGWEGNFNLPDSASAYARLSGSPSSFSVRSTTVIERRLATSGNSRPARRSPHRTASSVALRRAPWMSGTW